MAFLERIVGEERLRSEPEFAARLATICGHHLMALRLLGVRLQARPTWRMADSEQRLAASLSDCGVRHEDCAIFHERILPVVGLLGSGMRAAFRQLAVPDVPDLTVASAAALLGERPEECERILETLVDAHLLALPAPGCYRFHPLVRLVAQADAVPEAGSGHQPAHFETASAQGVRVNRSSVGSPHRPSALTVVGPELASP